MSTHQNQATPNGPTANRPGIRGHNSTYLSAVQKNAKSGSKSKPAGDGKIAKIEGQGSDPQGEDVKDMPAGFGSGHYQPNQG